jgi:hypothetical protein
MLSCLIFQFITTTSSILCECSVDMLYHIEVEDDKCHQYTCPDETGTLQPCGGSPYKAVYTFSKDN